MMLVFYAYVDCVLLSLTLAVSFWIETVQSSFPVELEVLI